MNWKKITVIFIVTMFVSIAVYDVIAIVGGGTEASISSTMIVWSYRFPLFPFLMGLICGHLFWRLKSNPDTQFIDQKKDGVK
jgi:hypothetical protein